MPTELVVDAADPSSLHSGAPDGLRTSRDAGAVFVRSAVVVDGVSDVAVARSGRLTGRVLAASSERPLLWRSDDGGRRWRSRPLPMVPDQVAAAADADVVAVAGEGDLVVLVSDVVYDVTPEGLPPRDVAVSAHPGGVRLIARTGTVLLRRDLVPRGPERDVAAALPRLDLRAADVVRAEAPTLLPADLDVPLLPGETRDVDYTLELPAAATPLDVFFLVDTTGSMGSVIEGLRRDLQEIVDDLAAAQIAAHFGVGEFKDYPTAPYGGSADVPYRRLRAIGPVDSTLVRAIEGLQASGGGDIPESAYTGLVQAASGAGDSPSVPAGRDAGFRPGALRVVVTVTDARFHDETGYPGPGLVDAVKALRAKGIRQVGLSVAGGGKAQLEEVAAATRAFAPVGGLDCDGDGKRDLAAGAALVCVIGDEAEQSLVADPTNGISRGTPVRIAPAIVGLLRSLRDEAAVELQTQRDLVARVVGPARVERVDFKQDRVLRFVVRYSCPRTGLPDDLVVPVRAVSRDAVVARTTATVRCGPPEVGRQELPPRSVASLAGIALLPLAPPPPAPIPQTQPNPQSQAQSQGQTQPQAATQPQVGAVAAEQEQVDVVVAGVGVVDEPEVSGELAMSNRPRGDAAAATLLAGAVVVTTATGLALRRRTATAPAPAWIARRR